MEELTTITSTTTAPEKPRKKTTKNRKKTTVAKKHTKKGGGKKTANTAEKKSPLTTGSTRSRLFKALSKFPHGLTAAKIKDKTGMLANSGHLAVLVKEESEKGRIRVSEVDIDGKGITLYLLTASGKKDLKDNKVDKRKSGSRIGKKWTEDRWTAQTKNGKATKKKKAKRVTKKKVTTAKRKKTGKPKRKVAKK